MVLVAAVVASGQTVTSTLSGTIRDEAGAVVSGASIRIKNIATPLIEPSKVEVSRVVGTQEIDTLPNIGRNFVDFVKLSGPPD